MVSVDVISMLNFISLVHISVLHLTEFTIDSGLPEDAFTRRNFNRVYPFYYTFHFMTTVMKY